MDAARVEQVLLNLLLNARHALPGGGLVEIRSKRCPAEPSRSGPALVCVEVSDNGHGMSDEVLGRVFEPFFTTRAEGRGTGLGLSAAKQVVEEHGGTIRIESKTGQGTTVFVYIPRLQVESMRSPPGRPRASNGLNGASEQLLLLVSDPQLSEGLSRFLCHVGYTVDIVSSAQQLRERLKTPPAIRLALLDADVPDAQLAPLLSSIASMDDACPTLVLGGGGPGSVRKPVEPEALLSAIREALGSARV